MTRTEHFAQADRDSWIGLLRLRAREAPHRPAFSWQGEKRREFSHLSYGELDRRARSIAARLSLVSPGERALLLYHPGLEFIEAFFGTLYAGLIAVPLQAGLDKRDAGAESRLRSVIADARPAVLLSTSKAVEQSRSALEDLGPLEPRQRLLTDVDAGGEPYNWNPPEAGRQTLALLQYTSGSTASPKGVMLTHGNLLDNSAVIHRAFRHSPASRGVIWLPPFHDMGLIGGVLQPLYGGFPVTLMSPSSFLLNPLRWLQLISDTRATTSGGPDFAYDYCLRRISPERRRELDLSSWQVAFNGADVVRPETLDRFAEAFAAAGFRREAFVPCYGLAEATLMVTSTPPDVPCTTIRLAAAELRERRVVAAAGDDQDDAETIRVAGSGRVDTGPEVVIVDPETRHRCHADEVGEVWVAGASVAAGYWRQPEETERTFSARLADSGEGPFLRTGDLGFVRNGELFIAGRLKDLLIFAGRNHHPEDIEWTVAQSHPWLRFGGCAAFSVPVDGDERLAVAVELDHRQHRALLRGSSPGSTDVDAGGDGGPSEFRTIESNIRRAVSERHGLTVFRVLLVRPAGLPRTPSGKVRRRACRRAYLSQSLKLVEDVEPCTSR